jgi:hypothetical protein
MNRYFVGIPGGTKAAEFREISALLAREGRGNGEASPPTFRAPDGSFRQQGPLYLFEERAEAEAFAGRLRDSSGDDRWGVFDVDVDAIERLVEEHRQLSDEPLLLAMYYDAGDDPKEIYLLEVLDNFGANGVSPDRELFELTYWAPNRHEPDAGRSWHLILTNPKEFETALRENWPQAEDIRRAVESGRYAIFYMDDQQGVRSRDLIHA